MSSVFKGPKRPRIAAPEPEPERIEVVEEEAEEARRRERKKLLIGIGGRRSTIKGGRVSALKRHLGE